MVDEQPTPPKSRGSLSGGKKHAKKMAQERLDIVDQMLRQCLSHSAITAILCQKWGIGVRQAQKYVSRVYAKWKEDAKGTLVDRTWLRRSQLEGVLELAVQDRDLRTAVMALDRLCRVDGVYAPERVEATVVDAVTRVKSMTTEERRRRITELAAKHGLNGPSTRTEH